MSLAHDGSDDVHVSTSLWPGKSGALSKRQRQLLVRQQQTQIHLLKKLKETNEDDAYLSGHFLNEDDGPRDGNAPGVTAPATSNRDPSRSPQKVTRGVAKEKLSPRSRQAYHDRQSVMDKPRITGSLAAVIELQRFFRGVLLRRRVIQAYGTDEGYTRPWRRAEAAVGQAAKSALVTTSLSIMSARSQRSLPITAGASAGPSFVGGAGGGGIGGGPAGQLHGQQQQHHGHAGQSVVSSSTYSPTARGAPALPTPSGAAALSQSGADSHAVLPSGTTFHAKAVSLMSQSPRGPAPLGGDPSRRQSQVDGPMMAPVDTTSSMTGAGLVDAETDVGVGLGREGGAVSILGVSNQFGTDSGAQGVSGSFTAGAGKVDANAGGDKMATSGHSILTGRGVNGNEAGRQAVAIGSTTDAERRNDDGDVDNDDDATTSSPATTALMSTTVVSGQSVGFSLPGQKNPTGGSSGTFVASPTGATNAAPSVLMMASGEHGPPLSTDTRSKSDDGTVSSHQHQGEVAAHPSGLDPSRVDSGPPHHGDAPHTAQGPHGSSAALPPHTNDSQAQQLVTQPAGDQQEKRGSQAQQQAQPQQMPSQHRHSHRLSIGTGVAVSSHLSADLSSGGSSREGARTHGGAGAGSSTIVGNVSNIPHHASIADGRSAVDDADTVGGVGSPGAGGARGTGVAALSQYAMMSGSGTSYPGGVSPTHQTSRLIQSGPNSSRTFGGALGAGGVGSSGEMGGDGHSLLANDATTTGAAIGLPDGVSLNVTALESNLTTQVLQALGTVQKRWRANLLMEEWSGWKKYTGLGIYNTAALVIQNAWVNRALTNRQRRARRRHRIYLNKEHSAAATMQWAWRGFVQRRIFSFYAALIKERCGADPYLVLKAINPGEAFLCDSASGQRVKFRLAGAAFPPVVVYKIFTHRNVADIGAFAPRDYTKTKSLNPRDLHLKSGATLDKSTAASVLPSGSTALQGSVTAKDKEKLQAEGALRSPHEFGVMTAGKNPKLTMGGKQAPQQQSMSTTKQQSHPLAGSYQQQGLQSTSQDQEGGADGSPTQKRPAGALCPGQTLSGSAPLASSGPTIPRASDNARVEGAGTFSSGSAGLRTSNVGALGQGKKHGVPLRTATDKTGWYERMENNPWRPIADPKALDPNQISHLLSDQVARIAQRNYQLNVVGENERKVEEWSKAATARLAKSKLCVAGDKRRSRESRLAKATRRRWLVTLYSAQRESEVDAEIGAGHFHRTAEEKEREAAAKRAIREDAAELFGMLSDEDIAAEAAALTEWTGHLDFDSYKQDWHRLATTTSSAPVKSDAPAA